MIRLKNPEQAGEADRSNANGKAASFECGSYVRISLCICEGVIEEAGFRSNGCGFAVAAADILAERMKGKRLTDLHGMDEAEISATIEHGLAEDVDRGFPADRKQCLHLVIEAFRDALADHHTSKLEEFSGEKALVCTCFGVTEDAIIRSISVNSLKSVAEVSEATNAGSGCGSCRMIIQELLDGYGNIDI